mgnify:CR=1 FL=1
MPDVVFRYKVVIQCVARIRASVANQSWGASFKGHGWDTSLLDLTPDKETLYGKR